MVTGRIVALCLAVASMMPMQAAPVVQWVKSVHDFGVFNEADGKQSCEMLLTNAGDEPLFITRVQPTCGCTAGEYPRAAIAPGDTVSVTLTYNPANRPGEFNKDVYVYTNTMPTRSVVTIRGNVIPTASTLDKHYPVGVGSLKLHRTIVPLGEVRRTSFRLGYVRGYNASQDTIVVSATSGERALQADVLPDTIAPAGTVTITMRLDGLDAPLWGLNVVPVKVKQQALHGGPVHECDLEATGIVIDDFKRLSEEQKAHPPVLAVDDRVDMGEIVAGAKATVRLTVRNTGKSPLEIRRLWSADPALSFKVGSERVNPGKQGGVDVTVDAALIDGNVINTEFTLMTSDPEHQLTTIRVVGTINR